MILQSLILAIIKKLKTTKSAGLDKVKADIFTIAAGLLADPTLFGEWLGGTHIYPTAFEVDC